jgi:hypothetical protein
MLKNNVMGESTDFDLQRAGVGIGSCPDSTKEGIGRYCAAETTSVGYTQQIRIKSYSSIGRTIYNSQMA